MASTSTGQNIEQRHRRIRLANLTKLIDVELDLLHESFQKAKRRIDPVIAQINQARHKFEGILQQGEGVEMTELDVERELRDLKQETSKLKSKIPFSLITPEYQPAADPNVIFQPQTHPPKPTTTSKPLLIVDDDDIWANKFQDFYFHINYFYQHRYSHEAIILQCFLDFPEGAFIKASLLCSYTNGFSLGYNSSESVISMACELVSKGFIKSVYKKHSSTTVDGFWMDPFLHQYLPRELNPVCLVNSSSVNGDDIIYSGSATQLSGHIEFLHLGKWQRSPIHHNIEMPYPNMYFKYARYMKNLMYISFRGVSVMKELPGFITHLWESNGTKKETKLKSLRILDLKACHHLEVLPSDIGNLCHSLTHFDMSKCYFLDHMPASLSQLTRLRVLKGFFVGETNNEEECCTLQDLSSMQYMVKLHVYTSLKSFPSENHLTTLQGFSNLRNLTICWGGCPTRDENRYLGRPKKAPATRLNRLVTRGSDHPVFPVYKKFSFRHLMKLDLRGAPETCTRDWLKPSNFEKLEKLYIRGGQLSHLRPNDKRGWSVKVLRLRHLSKLEMDWSELQNSFPNVVSLEKVECPILTSFPCDDDGLWTKENPELSYQYYMIDGR